MGYISLLFCSPNKRLNFLRIQLHLLLDIVAGVSVVTVCQSALSNTCLSFIAADLETSVHNSRRLFLCCSVCSWIHYQTQIWSLPAVGGSISHAASLLQLKFASGTELSARLSMLWFPSADLLCCWPAEHSMTDAWNKTSILEIKVKKKDVPKVCGTSELLKSPSNHLLIYCFCVHSGHLFLWCSWAK